MNPRSESRIAKARIVVLTGAYDDQYLRTRTDQPVVCVSAGKRLMLYRALAAATDAEIVLLSQQPRGRAKPQPLPACESKFDRFRQFFPAASGLRKVRFVTDMWRYVRHVARHVRENDILVLDNYEMPYVLAARFCRFLGKRNRVILEYEDGKHLIDRGFYLWLSQFAEWLGRPLVKAAILATPALSERLPEKTPFVIIPGLLRDDLSFNPLPNKGDPLGILYSGSLDYERGGPLLLEYLEAGSFPPNVVFHITGQGFFTDRLSALAKKFPGVVHFHGIVNQDELARIRGRCHYGLNLQSSINPISRVTYPSKTFDYLNAGLRVISTRAAGVPDVLGKVAMYLATEDVEGLSVAIRNAISSGESPSDLSCHIHSLDHLTFDGSVARLRKLLECLTQ